MIYRYKIKYSNSILNGGSSTSELTPPPPPSHELTSEQCKIPTLIKFDRFSSSGFDSYSSTHTPALFKKILDEMEKLTKDSSKYIKVTHRMPQSVDYYPSRIVKYAINPETKCLYIMSVYGYDWDEEFLKYFKFIKEAGVPSYSTQFVPKELAESEIRISTIKQDFYTIENELDLDSLLKKELEYTSEHKWNEEVYYARLNKIRDA